jgi:mannose-1-phosphate guanylyltransferase
MITYAFDHLLSSGIARFIVNTHHCASKYQEAFPEAKWAGAPILFRYEPVLLETGGGLKNIEDLVQEQRLLIYNGDVFSDLPLEKLMRFHGEQGNEVSLALRSGGGPCHIGLDSSGRIVDIRGMLNGGATQDVLFTGIYIVERTFFNRFRSGEKVSVIPAFLDMIRNREGLGGIVIDDGFWSDVGTLDDYQKMDAQLSGNKPESGKNTD